MVIDSEKLNIGAYCLDKCACTEQHVKDIRACGIDFIICPQYCEELLDLFSAHGIGAIVNGVVPGYYAGNAGRLEEVSPLSDYAFALDSYKPHPAILAVDIGDEPSAADFAHLGKVARLMSDRGISPYLNLYPSYGRNTQCTLDQVEAQLGCKDYGQYIQTYIDCVPTDYISFDFYVYSSNIPEMVKCFSTVADSARKSGRGLHAVLQVNSHLPEKRISESQMLFQAYVALAYGARCISWACYSPGWWYNNVLDGDGSKTEQYYKLARVNAHLGGVGKRYMRYKSIGTYLIKQGESYSDRDISFTANTDLILGKMNNGQNAGYVMVSLNGQGSELFINTRADGVTVDGRKKSSLIYLEPFGGIFAEVI